jgi:phosphoribosylaminoimidazolecarboxamide formyltransferase / IMP cyclohydrolase
MVKIERAILSVSDKTGIVELSRFLTEHNVEILSTGGTARTLKENGIKVKDVSEFTGFPEILDGRVKTLHPKIYGGILAIRDSKEHQMEMKENDLVPVDLIVCNLYPFEETLKKGAPHEEIIENIDIGGPTMLRAAAKNYKYVCVLSKNGLYEEFIKEMEKNSGSVSEEFSFHCASEVFRHTTGYDLAIANYFTGKVEKKELLPDEMDLRLLKVQNLRYGENPHQTAGWYRFVDKQFVRQQLQGKELSFNNLMDMESTCTLVNQFVLPACVLTKHTNPCGVAVDEDIFTAYEKALATDPLSAFGGIAGFNRKVDGKIAGRMTERFYEVVIAPDYDGDALEIFKKKKNLRVIKSPAAVFPDYDFKTLSDGLLIQTPDDRDFDKMDVVTNRKPDERELAALRFGWTVCRFVKSNAIVIATENQTIGIGAGQMSRYDSARVAVMKMKDNFKNTVTPLVVASDAFFPFPDSIDVLKESGVTAIIQPGGALKDKEVIAACNSYGIAMVLTGMRHFRH